MHKMGGRFPAGIEESHALDMAASIREDGYVSDYIRDIADRYRVMLQLGYDLETINEVYKEVA